MPSKSQQKRLEVQQPKKITAEQALEVAQSYTTLREQRLEIQKKVDEIEVREKQAKKMLMDMLIALNVNSVGDTKKIYELVTQDEPTVDSFEQLYAHIRSTGEFDLLYRRVNSAAVKERWDLGQEVPGIKKFPAISLSVTKAKGA